MKCSVCGAEVTDGHKFCASCGSPVAASAAADAVDSAAQEAAGVGAAGAAAASAPFQAYAQQDQQQYQYQQQYQQQQYQQQQYQQQYQQQQYQQYQQPVQQVWPEQPATSRALATSIYWTSLIGLIIALCIRDKNDPYVTQHINQALVITIGLFISGLLSIIIIGMITGIFLIVMMFMGSIRASQSSMAELPIIGKIHILK